MTRVQWGSSGKKGELMSSQSRMRALFRRLSRRLALPSVLMGLVVFSFTLLFFGAAVYTAALPSLVADAEQGDGAYAQIASGALVNALVGSSDGDGDQGQSNTAHAFAANQTQGRVTSSGRVVGGVGGISGGVSSPNSPSKDEEDPSKKPDDSDSNKGDDSSDKPSETPDDPGTGEDPETPPVDENPGGGEGGGDTPGGDENPPIDPDKEQADYEFLLAEFQAIDSSGGYIDQIEACTTAFEHDALASIEVRIRHQKQIQVIREELTSHWLVIMNNRVGLSSAYGAAAGDLLAMYRCLNAYLATLNSAWEINLSFEDPSAHVDEFMQPLRDAEVNGQNEDLAEFNSYYSGFVL